MTDHLRTLAQLATASSRCYPNAGLPDEHGHYDETAESLALKMRRFVDEGWVNVVGGCCGTTPGPHPRRWPRRWPSGPRARRPPTSRPR